MWISERRLKIIYEVVEKARRLKRESREDKYEKISQLAKKERDNFFQGLANRGWVECKQCSHWCKKIGKPLIMWPSAKTGKTCPLCESCKLTRVSIV